LDRAQSKPMGMKMARYAWLALFALLTATARLAALAAETTSADVEAITKIEMEWIESLEKGNKAFFEGYLSDDFTYISEDGVLQSGRAAFVDNIMPGFKIRISDARVTIHGTTGVTTGRFTATDNAGVSTSTLYTNVWAKGSDGWKAVALQETKTN
jgi:hypothetical protein